MAKALRYALPVMLAGLLPAPAPAQAPAGATEERQIIERLTRGIRMPGTDAGTPVGAVPAPTLTPAAPAPAGAPPVPAPLSLAPPPIPTAPPARDTTAPAGVPAISLTVNFASGSWTLSPGAQAALAPLGRALSAPELQPFRFRIEGHTDTVGPAAMNRDLSQRRAEAVREHLMMRYAIAPDRLVAQGLGETQLLVDTKDEVSEARNRRVQILNLGG